MLCHVTLLAPGAPGALYGIVLWCLSSSFDKRESHLSWRFLIQEYSFESKWWWLQNAHNFWLESSKRVRRKSKWPQQQGLYGSRISYGSCVSCIMLLESYWVLWIAWVSFLSCFELHELNSWETVVPLWLKENSGRVVHTSVSESVVARHSAKSADLLQTSYYSPSKGSPLPGCRMDTWR